MDSKQLFEAACVGNVEVLHKLLDENPLILTDIALANISKGVSSQYKKLYF